MTSNLPSDTRTIEVRPCPLPGSPGAQVAPIVGPLSKKEFMQAVRSCNWESLGIPGTAEPHFQNPRIFPISPSGRIFPFLFLRSPFLDFFIMIFHFFAWSAPFPWLVPCLFFWGLSETTLPQIQPGLDHNFSLLTWGYPKGTISS